MRTLRRVIELAFFSFTVNKGKDFIKRKHNILIFIMDNILKAFCMKGRLYLSIPLHIHFFIQTISKVSFNLVLEAHSEFC